MKRLTVSLLLLGVVLAYPVRTAQTATFTNKQLGKGSLTTTLTTILYTVPGATTTIVTTVTVANKNTTTIRAVTIKAAGVAWLPAFGMSANSTEALQFNHVLNAADTITGGQDVGTDVDYFISGVEIT